MSSPKLFAGFARAQATEWFGSDGLIMSCPHSSFIVILIFSLQISLIKAKSGPKSYTYYDRINFQVTNGTTVPTKVEEEEEGSKLYIYIIGGLLALTLLLLIILFISCWIRLRRSNTSETTTTTRQTTDDIKQERFSSWFRFGKDKTEGPDGKAKQDEKKLNKFKGKKVVINEDPTTATKQNEESTFNPATGEAFSKYFAAPKKQ